MHILDAVIYTPIYYVVMYIHVSDAVIFMSPLINVLVHFWVALIPSSYNVHFSIVKSS